MKIYYEKSEIPDELLHYFVEVDDTEKPTQPCTVMDPFAGSGTTLIVANDLKRRAIGCDLNAKYVRMAEKRLAGRSVKLF